MKNLKNIFIISVIGIFLMALVSCKHKHDHKDHESTEASIESTGDEYTAKYICPMHCEGSGSGEPGECPVCGMDYVLNEDHQEDGHKHDEDDHEGHNH